MSIREAADQYVFNRLPSISCRYLVPYETLRGRLKGTVNHGKAPRRAAAYFDRVERRDSMDRAVGGIRIPSKGNIDNTNRKLK